MLMYADYQMFVTCYISAVLITIGYMPTGRNCKLGSHSASTVIELVQITHDEYKYIGNSMI